jgi:hypothetical protein
MKLTQLIEKLNHIRTLHGGDAEVLMADYIPVVSPVFFEDSKSKIVFITDQE